MSLFDNAITRGHCPACGREAEKSLRWFRLVRELLGPLACPEQAERRRVRDGLRKAAAQRGAAIDEGE